VTDDLVRVGFARLEAQIKAGFDSLRAQIAAATQPGRHEPDPLLVVLFEARRDPRWSKTWTAGEIFEQAREDPALARRLADLRVGSSRALGLRLAGILKRQAQAPPSNLRLVRSGRCGSGAQWSIESANDAIRLAAARILSTHGL
jgi:hypothetical protein